MEMQGRTCARSILRAIASLSLALCLLHIAYAQDCGGGNPCGGDDAASQSCSCPNTGAGNPIDVLTGNKYVREVDFDLPGELSLGFVRHYNSVSTSGGAFGGGWSHSYETALLRAQHGSEVTLQIVQADGRRLSFVPLKGPAGSQARYVSRPAGYGVITEDIASIERLRWSRLQGRSHIEELHPWVWKWPDGRRLVFDASGLLKEIETSQGNRLRLEHDRHGRLARIADGYGRFAHLDYWDDPGELLPSYDPASQQPSVSGQQNRLKSLTLFDGRSAQYRYDTHGLLSHIHYSDGTSRRYEYTAAGDALALHKRWGRDGAVAGEYRYDTEGRAVASEQGVDGHRIAIEYRAAGTADYLNESWVTDALGNRTVYRWRRNGAQAQLVEAIGPGCASCPAANVRYGYDENGAIERIERLSPEMSEKILASEALERDAFGRVVARYRLADQRRELIESYAYGSDDALAKPTRVERPSAAPGRTHVYAITYNERGQPTELIESGYAPESSVGVFDEIIRTTSYRYFDADDAIHLIGKLRAIDGPLSGEQDTIHYEYGARGELTRIRYATKAAESFEYDDHGRLHSYTPIDGITVDLGYDGEGRVSQIRRAGLITQIRYDALGRIQRLRDPIGQLFLLEYDSASRLTSISDGANNRMVLELDPESRPIARRLLNPDGTLSQEILTTPGELGDSPSQHSLWAPSILSLIRLPAVKPWETKASAIIRPAAVPEAGLAHRQLIDKRGLSSDYVYDDFGRLAYVYNPDSGVTRFEYDLADRMTVRHLGDRTVRYEYDELNRITRSESLGETTIIEYGVREKPIRIRYAAGEDLFEYDSAGRLITRSQLIDGHRFVTQFDYDEVGRLSQKILPDGQILAYRYNASVHAKPGVLTAIERKSFFGSTQIVSGLNEVTDSFALQTSLFGNGLEFRRQLDLRGRLIAYGTPTVADFQFEIDAAGRIAGVNGSSSRSFSYDDAGRLEHAADLVEARSSLTFSFDPADNLRIGRSSDTSVMLRIDAQSNRVSSRIDESGVVQDYAYDAAGRTTQIGRRRFEYDDEGRLARILEQGRPIAAYAYNAFGERIRKVTYSGNERKVTYFFYDGSKLTAEADESGRITKQFVYLQDRPVAMLVDREVYALHTDWRGTPVAATDENQRVVWEASADVIGRVRVQRAAVELNLRGSNQYFDDESGYHYNTYRYFDPATSRYLTPDPIGQLGGLNLYAFVAGDPVNLVDRLGLQSTPSWGEDRTLAHNTSVADWGFERRLRYVFNMMAELYPGEVGEALRDLVQPVNIALTAGVFLIWAAAHATPIGWAGDLIMAGVGAYFLGRGVLTIIKTAFEVAQLTTAGACVGHLYQASQILGTGLAQATVEFGSGLVAGGSARVASAIRQLLRRRPSTASSPDVLPSRPRPPPPQALSALIGRKLFGPQLSRVPVVRNDGILGEQIAKQILESLSGGIFRGIRNSSNNGPDLIRIDPVTKTIQHVEVKSSQRGRPGWPEGDLGERFDKWIDEIVDSGTLKGEPVSAADRDYARQIRSLMRNEGYSVEHRVMQVSIPTAGTTGVPIAELFAWP